MAFFTNDLKQLIQEIELETHKEIKIKKIPLLIFKINDTFNKIRLCKTADEASPYFNLLQAAQDCVCGLIF